MCPHGGQAREAGAGSLRLVRERLGFLGRVLSWKGKQARERAVTDLGHGFAAGSAGGGPSPTFTGGLPPPSAQKVCLS